MRDQQLTIGRDLLDHRFYQRWVMGDLSLDELRNYAGQYAHVVSHLAGWLRRTAAHSGRWAPILEKHAREEDAHVALWGEFARALGLTRADLAAARPNPATAKLLMIGDELSAQPAGVAVAWALEVQTPAVSVEKLRGLKTYYAIDAANGGRYFEVHSSRDLVHAAELNEAIIGLSPGQLPTAQRTADQITDRVWDLLTSVESLPLELQRGGSTPTQGRHTRMTL